MAKRHAPRREDESDFYVPPETAPLRGDIPAFKMFPEDSVQCDDCGGHGCDLCSGMGWFAPGDHPGGRRCANPECNRPLCPDWVPVYCSNDCALDDF